MSNNMRLVFSVLVYGLYGPVQYFFYISISINTGENTGIGISLGCKRVIYFMRKLDLTLHTVVLCALHHLQVLLNVRQGWQGCGCLGWGKLLWPHWCAMLEGLGLPLPLALPCPTQDTRQSSRRWWLMMQMLRKSLVMVRECLFVHLFVINVTFCIGIVLRHIG